MTGAVAEGQGEGVNIFTPYTLQLNLFIGSASPIIHDINHCIKLIST